MEWFPYSILLVPPGTIRATVEAYQDELTRLVDDIGALGFSPGIRVDNYLELPAKPGELRLSAPIAFGRPLRENGCLYLPALPGREPGAIRTLLPAGVGAGRYQPLLPGIHLVGLSADHDLEHLPPFSWEERSLRSEGFDLVCYGYVFDLDAHGELLGLVEREEWRVPIRKPLAGKRKKG